MESEFRKKPIYNRLYYISSVVILVLAATYCTIIYFTDNIRGTDSAYELLLGIPNYYFFYFTIFPFVTAGVVYFATSNVNIRFFGPLNPDLDAGRKNKVLKFRIILLVAAVIFSIAIAAKDAMDKGHTLPPYSFNMSTKADMQHAIQTYLDYRGQVAILEKDYEAKIQGSEANEILLNNELSLKREKIGSDYLQGLKSLGFKGESISGFTSFSSWYRNSSFIYKFEDFLSWIAALIMSVFVSQLFLIIIVKDYIRQETKNLMLWMLMLCSLWIPTKIFSAYYYSLAPYSPPAVVWFAIIILAIGIVLALFIKAEKNDMTKYATAVVAVFSTASTVVSVLAPEYLEIAIKVISGLGWILGGIILFVMALSIYLVTDNLIQSFGYGKPISENPASTGGNHDDTA